jgi:hypothetical protein
MMLPLDWLTDLSLLFLRVMVGLVFMDSGYADLKNPIARSKSLEVSRDFAQFLGVAELLGGLAVIAGVLQDLRVENRVLGQRWTWLVLRARFCFNALRDYMHQRRQIRSAPLIQKSRGSR